MKNFTLTLCLLFALAVNAMAQDTPALNKALEKTCNSVTRLMVQSMGLNENEYIQLRALNQKRLAKAAEVAKMYSNDAEMLDARLKEIESSFEGDLYKILNTRQATAYAEFKAKPEGNFLSMVQEVTKGSKK
ncbi:hypothetical protein EFA69_02140 [Rufibacter immobilis]|uniref:DUF4168 domain-containing protein n=1 Tax=Rufibacter immobilis TaxID=1348778 RepID=A0A3M9N7P6_9BACT|nr:hypothetical protein [Rufibacter immobilis]RNI33233.1 hypothetical protein EFA69_02140 [Rufibacter immobilis]